MPTARRSRRPPPRGSRGRRRPERRRWVRTLLWLLLLPGALLVIAAAVTFFYFFVSVPLPSDIGSGPTVLLDATGQEFATLTSQFQREDVALADLHQDTVRAVLAAEDADFYEHPGVSVPGILRALWQNVTSGEVTGGGSTITQQYVKVQTADDEQSLVRKIREAALALKLEREFTKDQILEFYLNSVYFGRGAYGIQAAAQAYFGVDAAALTIDQAALLAGVLPAPSSYDPAVNPQAALVRYDYVLTRMVDEAWLDPVAASAYRTGLPATTSGSAAIADGPAPWFVDLVRRELERQLGVSAGSGLTVQTTLNPGVQAHADAAYAEAFPTVAPTGALVAIDPATGGVVAVVGGEDHRTDQVNLALAERQPGSTFKPFTLTAWVEAGNDPESRLDGPAQVTLPGADAGRDWVVSNYGGSSYGSVTVREATASSINTVYAQMQAQVTPQVTADVANRLLGRPPERALPPQASLVLGTEEVTPLELAGAYNVLAAGGVRHAPFTVVSVHRGDVMLYSHPQDAPRVLDEGVSATVVDTLRGVITSGTGEAADIGRPAAGKTGTTQNYGDAWFAGFTPNLTAVVWMGNRDNNETMEGQPTGGGLPAQVWARFMAAALEGVPATDFPAPPGGLTVTGEAPPVAATGIATATPTATPTASATATPTATASATATPEPTDTVTQVPTAPPLPTEVPTEAPTLAPEPTVPPVEPTLPPPTAQPSTAATPPVPRPRETGGG